jgi:hypothetical protein
MNTRSTLPVACAAGAALLLSMCAVAHGREPRWSLDPRVAPFPCGAVDLDGNNMSFRQPLVIVCNGNEILEMPAGSLLGINVACHGTTAILHHDFDEKNALFDVARKACRRQRR